MSRVSTLLARETALAWGKGGGPMVAVGFYAGVATLLPLAVGSEPERLAAIAPGAAWVALALAALLSLDRLFERDYEDGSLDLLTLSPVPLEIICAVKCLAQWLATGLPLALAAPVAAIALGASPQLSGLVIACALLGGLAFSFMGGIGAALSLGARRGGLLPIRLRPWRWAPWPWPRPAATPCPEAGGLRRKEFATEPRSSGVEVSRGAQPETTDEDDQDPGFDGRPGEPDLRHRQLRPAAAGPRRSIPMSPRSPQRPGSVPTAAARGKPCAI